jgi:hypothetical protein
MMLMPNDLAIASCRKGSPPLISRFNICSRIWEATDWATVSGRLGWSICDTFSKVARPRTTTRSVFELFFVAVESFEHANHTVIG